MKKCFALFLLPFMLTFPLRTLAQRTMVDSTHEYSRLIKAFYHAKSVGNQKAFRNLGHQYYTQTNAPVTSPQDSLLLAHKFSLKTFPKVRVYDTVLVRGTEYCKIDYTLNCTKKVPLEKIPDAPKLEQMYNRMFGTRIVYFDKDTESLRYYQNKSALLIRRAGEDWTILEFDAQKISSYFSIEPRESFYAVEGIGACTLPAYTPEQLGKHVYDVIAEGKITSLACETGIQRDELIWSLKNEGRNEDEDELYRSLIYKKKTIEHDARDLQQSFNWRETKFSRVFSSIDRANGMAFSAILVEFEYRGGYKYFEIEAVETPGGWRIIDDISGYSFTEKNKAFIASRE